MDVKDFNSAIADFNKVISLSPDNPLAFYFRGISKDKLHQYAAAILDFDQAIKLKPGYADAYNCRGEANYHRKLLTDARADWDKANELGCPLAALFGQA